MGYICLPLVLDFELMTTEAQTLEVSSLGNLYEGKQGTPIFLQGDNFSGRSEAMRWLTHFATEQDKLAIVIPPEIHPAFSGLTSTVSDELMLHLGCRSKSCPFWRTAEEWDLLMLGKQHPLDLSGGQQALLGIVCKLALRPRFFGLDGTLEQLDPENFRRVIKALTSPDLFSKESVAIIAHNGAWPQEQVSINTLPTDAIFIPDKATEPPDFDSASFSPEDTTSTVLDFHNATFRYPRSPAIFANLNLRLHSGRIYRLAGANGAGKSTFAKILCGVLQLTSGSLAANGKLFNPYSCPGTLAQLHFQNPDTQLFGISVAKEIETLPMRRRDSALSFVGLETFKEKHPFDLPFVLRKRLALTLTLHGTTPWLIFDEPTVGLDQIGQNAVCDALCKLKQAGHGVILISHNSSLDDILAPEILSFLQTETP
jgi:energy-coupling factor transporter ATP-binding protein EcfA2